MPHSRLVRQINASRATVYRALLDAHAVATWMVPSGMTSHVHEFEPVEGGSFRISLTYDDPDEAGKSSGSTDTYHGRFVRLVPDEQVVEVIEFETDAPDLQGEMTVTYALTDQDGGTEIAVVYEHLPPGLSLKDNETGTRMALDKLAALAESTEASER